MSEPAPASTPPPQPGPVERLVEKITGHAEHAETSALHIADDVKTAIQDHAGTVFDVASGLLGVAKLIDPADAELFAAISALVPKVLGMAETAAALAGAALKGA